MTSDEFVQQVCSYGVHIPAGIAGQGGRAPFYKEVFGFSDTGSGNPRDYSTSNVREVVAWSLWMELTGLSNMKAIHLLSDQDFGWVVMSDNGVEWIEEIPSLKTFIDGAICMPVPAWVT